MDGLLGERLNGEPVVFRGYTDTELLLAIAVSAGFWFPVAGGTTLYQKWKRGRPEYYLQQQVCLWLTDTGFVKPHNSPSWHHRLGL